jgi:hypothetical protein
VGYYLSGRRNFGKMVSKRAVVIRREVMTEKRKRTSRVITKRKPLTVSEILTRDDINTVVKEILDNRSDMSSLIIIYEDKDGAINSNHSTMDLSKATYLLEQVKHGLLSGEE